MWTRQYKKRNTGVLIVPAITALFLAYFGFHAFNGEYGLYAKYRLEERAVSLESELEALRKQRADLERRVSLLRNGTIQKDMLDEQVRRALDYVRADEITIYRPSARGD